MPPSTIVLDNIVAVLRRSPATIVHQDRHHAVVLTELFPDILLDRSPGIVIGDLNHVEYDYIITVLLNASARDLQRYVDASNHSLLDELINGSW